jgi:predicted TIM-barrel fold metal-dependent hydrolase
MRRAASYDLPVQLHTGHMAGIRNDIVKTNASHLIPSIEMHENVQFDLFHGNWPYMDEYLYMGKNYPNVYLNLCWAQSIDPLYCVELMKRAVMTVPHNKLFAFGGDTGMIEWVAGYLSLAKDNVAIALSELSSGGWMSIDEAKQLGLDWFFNNPNEFYKLGL